MTLLQKLINKLEYSTETYCWLWNGRIRKGYGEIKYNGKHFGAHRVAYQYFVKDIPDGLCVLHKCDVPNCCNPMHLYIGTKQDNADDRERRNRSNYNNAARGEKNGRSKLTEKQVLEIRESKDTQVVLAKRYHISRSHISNVRNRKMWKHID